MSKTVSSAAVSGTVVENNLVPFGSALHGRDGPAITELEHFFLSCQSAMHALLPGLGRTMERWSRLTCHTIFDHRHVSLIEPPQSRGTTRGLLRCRRTSHAPKQRSSPMKCSLSSEQTYIMVDGNSPKSQTPKSKRRSRRANDQYGVTLEDSALVTALTELT